MQLQSFFLLLFMSGLKRAQHVLFLCGLKKKKVCLSNKLLQAIHLAQASFQLDAFGSTFTLDLALNK